MKSIKKILIFIIILNILPFYCLADDSNDDEIDYINTLEVSSENDNIVLNSKYAKNGNKHPSYMIAYYLKKMDMIKLQWPLQLK